MKKHSQINEKFSFFEHLSCEAELFLPELVASCDSTNRASPLALFWACSLFILSIQDETSSEDAFIAVKSLYSNAMYQWNNLEHYYTQNCTSDISGTLSWKLTWNRFYCYRRGTWHQSYPSLIPCCPEKARIDGASQR